MKAPILFLLGALIAAEAAFVQEDVCDICPNPTPVGTICCIAGQNCPNGSPCCPCGAGKSCLCPGSGPEPPPAPTPPPGPSPPGQDCSKSCKSTLDCANNQLCQFCLNMTGPAGNLTGRCGSQCGQPCALDSDCWFDTRDNCNYCYGGVCSQTNPNAMCGSPCVSDITCRNAPLNETTDCRLCYSKANNSVCQNPTGGYPTGECICGAGCGRRCSIDAECVAPSCPKCADFGGGPESYRCNGTASLGPV